MPSFAPLADPAFVLQWQVHVVVVSLFAIFAAWWGMTRRPWFVPPTLLVGLLWLFVPLEAPEPAFLPLVATPILAAGCGAVHWWVERRRRSGPADDASARPSWRFRLSDALWLMVVVGLTCALAARLWQLPWPAQRAYVGGSLLYWPDIVANAVSLLAIAVALLIASKQQTWRGRFLAGAAALFCIGVAVYVHQAFVRKELLLIYQWELLAGNWVSAGGVLTPPGDRYIFAVYLRTYLEFAAIFVVGLVALKGSNRVSANPLRVAVRALAGCGLLALAVGLSVVYAEILNRPDWPAESFPPRNRRDEFRSILARHEVVNPQSWSVDDLRTSKNEAAANPTAALFEELRDVLTGDDITGFDSRTDKADAENETSLDYILRGRAMSRALHAQAKADWAAGRRQSAIDHDMLNLRMGAAMQRRTIALEALVGIAVEGIATHHLNEIRKDLTCEEATPILAALKQVGNARESLELLIHRDKVFTEEGTGWRGRLDAAVGRLRGIPSAFEQVLGDASKRRDATLALLQADLAIRCYREKHDRLPDDLSALIPNYLDGLPVDPYSKKPLIYKAGENSFLLYSVGKDGDDDGGKFSTLSESYQRPGELDLDLDTFTP